MEREKSFLCVHRQYSQAQLCVVRQGVEKEKKAGKEARAWGTASCYPPLGLLVGSGDLGPGPLAVRASAQGLTGGHRP